MLLDGADQGEIAGLAGDAFAFLARAFSDDSAHSIAQRARLDGGARRRISRGVTGPLLLERLRVRSVPVREQPAEARRVRRWRRGGRLSQGGGKGEHDMHERLRLSGFR